MRAMATATPSQMTCSRRIARPARLRQSLFLSESELDKASHVYPNLAQIAAKYVF